MKKTFFLTLITACAVLLCSCVHNVSPNTYTRDEVGVASRVTKGVIISRRVVKIEATSGVGGLAGAVGGAGTGAMIGGSNVGAHVAGAVGGAVVAGVVGHELDKAINRRTGYEYIIKLEDGKTISITQERSVKLALGQHVLIIYGVMTRVVPDDTLQNK